jgi:quercetin dioxygenase-like cupin family protein
VDQVPEILESANDNNGSRTIIKTVLGPGATVVSHYHTLFTETFEVLEGEIDVWNGDSKITLTVGQSATVAKTIIHRYQVGAKETVVKLIFIPGNIDVERAMKIIKGLGLQQDGFYTQLSATDKDGLVLIAIIADLTHSNTIGDIKKKLDKLYESEGSKIEQVKTELLEKYSNNH